MRLVRQSVPTGEAIGALKERPHNKARAWCPGFASSAMVPFEGGLAVRSLDRGRQGSLVAIKRLELWVGATGAGHLGPWY
jgi:hypothetical protein